MGKYRRRAVIDAILFDGTNVAELKETFGADAIPGMMPGDLGLLEVQIAMWQYSAAPVGTWITKGENPGTVVLWHASVFDATFEKIEEE
jgi:hypothetical protein